MHPSCPLPPSTTPRHARRRRGAVDVPRLRPRASRCAVDAPAARVLLARALQALLFVAVVAMSSLPQARTVSETFGWLPLWLLAIPSAAWLALWAAARFGDAADAPTARATRRLRGVTAAAPRPRPAAATRRALDRAAA